MVDFSPLRYLANDPNKPYDPLGAMNPITSGLASLAYRGFMAPGQALASTTPITSEQMIAPAQDMMALMAGGGVPAAERGAVGAFGGRLASTTGDELVSNLARAPMTTANESAPFVRPAFGRYEGAVKQQQIERMVGPDTPVGDRDYWRKLADQQGLTWASGRPNPSFAARKYSEGGKTAMIINSDGTRSLFHDGQLITREFSRDLPKE
jgi:hypothetical protein